jgi:hypothetical protein
MCYGVALAGSEIPRELAGHPGLPRRAFTWGKQEEFRFLWAARRPCLPVLRDGRVFLARWGNTRGQSRFLPRTGWTWLETIRSGGWRDSGAIPVDIPATFGLDRGRWVCVLCEAFRQRRDLEVKRAIATALLVLVTERSGPSPSPPERPNPDPNREECPRVRDKSSSERVAKRPSGPTGARMNADDPGHRVRSAEGPDGEG